MPDVLSILRSAAARTLFARSEVRAAFLFGSHARGCEMPESDVDVAVLFARDLDPLRRLQRIAQLQEELQRLLVRRVDLVSLQDAGPLLSFEAVIRGVTVHSMDDEETFRCELVTRRRYEEFVHIQGFYTRALREKLGIA